MKDYYQVLGVERSASEAQIKRAYKDLAKKHHPDMFGGASEDQKKKNEDYFKDISEAYAVLSDQEKRQKYDLLGRDGFRSNYTSEDIFSGINFSDLFSDIGSSGDGEWSGNFADLFGGRGGGRYQRRAGRRGRDVEYPLEAGFFDLYHGAKKTVSFYPGAGEKKTDILVTLPRGLKDGAKLKVAGKGARGSGGASAGDLYVRVTMSPDQRWERRGDDLYHSCEIALSDALLGGTIKVPGPGGDKQVTVPAGSGSGRKLRLRGLGFSKFGSSDSYGDLYVVLKIAVPGELTDDQKKVAEQLRKVGL